MASNRHYGPIGKMIRYGVPVLAMVAGLILAQVVVGAEEEQPGPPPGEMSEPSAAEEVAQLEGPETREALTKILLGMRENDAPEDVQAPIESQLEQLGGIDPSVPPLDGPDGESEWAVQREIDEINCAQGDKDACDRLSEAEQHLDDR